MQARQTRNRHFKSSLGSMLNENYDGGRLPSYPVKQEDFVYIPSSSLPVSRSALNFLQHKFPEPASGRPASNTTSSSLYQAYRRAFEQPVGLVHYDRDPMYWGSKERKPRGNIISTPNSVKSLLMGNYTQLGLVPDEVPAASTPASVSSVRSSQHEMERPASIAGVTPESASRSSGKKYKTLSNNLDERNILRLWSPDSEAAGFKPYTPFSGSLFDYDKQPKYNTPEIPPEVWKTSDVLAAPKYADALHQVVGGSGPDNVLKIHGNPQYPSKAMNTSDVPNYMAWTQIYPYCPLTQVEGQDKPVVVPPRGFTPSTARPSPSAKPARDLKKAKMKIFAGLEPCKTPKAKQLLCPKKASKSHPVIVSNDTGKILEHNKHQVDTSTTRRLLELKLQAPEGWYSGQTPTHTPTPDHTLPIKASRSWTKQYSPARIRHFLRAAAADEIPRL